jgi:hypothetical protein
MWLLLPLTIQLQVHLSLRHLHCSSAAVDAMKCWVWPAVLLLGLGVSESGSAKD